MTFDVVMMLMGWPYDSFDWYLTSFSVSPRFFLFLPVSYCFLPVSSSLFFKSNSMSSALIALALFTIMSSSFCFYNGKNSKVGCSNTVVTDVITKFMCTCTKHSVETRGIRDLFHHQPDYAKAMIWDQIGHYNCFTCPRSIKSNWHPFMCLELPSFPIFGCPWRLFTTFSAVAWAIKMESTWAVWYT